MRFLEYSCLVYIKGGLFHSIYFLLTIKIKKNIIYNFCISIFIVDSRKYTWNVPYVHSSVRIPLARDITVSLYMNKNKLFIEYKIFNLIMLLYFLSYLF